MRSRHNLLSLFNDSFIFIITRLSNAIEADLVKVLEKANNKMLLLLPRYGFIKAKNYYAQTIKLQRPLARGTS